MFYLVCGFCRWTTREAGLPDQPVGNNNTSFEMIYSTSYWEWVVC